jgi:hypothetical protein
MRVNDECDEANYELGRTVQTQSAENELESAIGKSDYE